MNILRLATLMAAIATVPASAATFLGNYVWRPDFDGAGG